MARNQPARGRSVRKQNTFFGGAAILALGIMVVKVIGMFYKIPLAGIIGDAGNADFGNAYNIYAVLLTISTAGLPVAVSKMVSEANALGRRNQVRRVFRVSLGAFLVMGAVSFAVMFFCAEQLAGMMHDSLAAPGIRALAPAVVCVGCLAALRGYTQGHSDMTPTSVSQIIEAMCKLVVGLGLAAFVMSRVYTAADLARYRPELDVSALGAQELEEAVAATQASRAAAGAITGVTVGTVVALVYMVLRYLARRGSEPSSQDVPDSGRHILTSLLAIAVPITISSSMVGIVTVIDSSLVQGQLQSAQSLSEDASRVLYGNYQAALNIYNLPTSLMAAVTSAVIPAVSGALARRDRPGAARITGSALRVSALLSIPMGVGLCVLGTPIMRLLYPSFNIEVAGPLLSTLGIATPFVCLMLVCNSVLQAHGFINLPVAVMLAGGVLKIVTNYNLVGRVGIAGAPVGNVLCFALCLALDLAVIARVVPRRPRYLPLFLKPLVSAAAMGAAVWAVYGLVSRLFTVTGGDGTATLSRMGSVVSVAAAILVGMAVYFTLILVTHGISRSDLSLMPKGDRIAAILHIR